jgi:hypothetical protein
LNLGAVIFRGRGRGSGFPTLLPFTLMLLASQVSGVTVVVWTRSRAIRGGGLHVVRVRQPDWRYNCAGHRSRASPRR